MSDPVRALLYRAIRELSYVQEVEGPRSVHELYASGEGAEIVEAGMKLLGVTDLSAEELDEVKS